MTLTTDRLPVAVIGAGPVGLAAAAHLVAGSLEDARQVQLVLPQTGVCGSDPLEAPSASSSRALAQRTSAALGM